MTNVGDALQGGRGQQVDAHPDEGERGRHSRLRLHRHPIHGRADLERDSTIVGQSVKACLDMHSKLHVYYERMFWNVVKLCGKWPNMF